MAVVNGVIVLGQRKVHCFLSLDHTASPTTSPNTDTAGTVDHGSRQWCDCPRPEERMVFLVPLLAQIHTQQGQLIMAVVNGVIVLGQRNAWCFLSHC